ncbi:spore germination protein GerPC [Cohnella cholangitidis]|nr:spore germination protein GerPC [Cohnella cholangitidis]
MQMQMPMQQPRHWNVVYPQNGYPQPLQAPVGSNWTELLQRLHQSELKLQQVVDQLASMQKQLDDLKNKPPLHIEYHFDQLKVNRLEGTLNVGLSPQGIQGIESFEAPDPSCWNVKQEKSEGDQLPIGALQNEMSDYMNNDASWVLQDLEKQFGIRLEDDHRRKIVEDVKKQLNDRVRFYATTIAYPDKGTDDERKRWNESVKEKTRRDIQAAFSAYLSKQIKTEPQKGESASS